MHNRKAFHVSDRKFMKEYSSSCFDCIRGDDSILNLVSGNAQYLPPSFQLGWSSSEEQRGFPPLGDLVLTAATVQFLQGKGGGKKRGA
jgi:hypothetical protein